MTSDDTLLDPSQLVRQVEEALGAHIQPSVNDDDDQVSYGSATPARSSPTASDSLPIPLPSAPDPSPPKEAPPSNRNELLAVAQRLIRDGTWSINDDGSLEENPQPQATNSTIVDYNDHIDHPELDSNYLAPLFQNPAPPPTPILRDSAVSPRLLISDDSIKLPIDAPSSIISDCRAWLVNRNCPRIVRQAEGMLSISDIDTHLFVKGLTRKSDYPNVVKRSLAEIFGTPRLAKSMARRLPAPPVLGAPSSQFMVDRLDTQDRLMLTIPNNNYIHAHILAFMVNSCHIGFDLFENRLEPYFARLAGLHFWNDFCIRSTPFIHHLHLSPADRTWYDHPSHRIRIPDALLIGQNSRMPNPSDVRPVTHSSSSNGLLDRISAPKLLHRLN